MIKLTKVWPRQPFIGLALGALAGITIADWWPQVHLGLGAVIVSAGFALTRQSSRLTYVFVACAFFCLHSYRVTHSPGVRFGRALGPEPQAMAVRGTVVSEPRVSARGSANFLLRATATTRDGITSESDVTLSARWRGEVRYGDEVQLFGVVQLIEPPRNPGEFNMQKYLQRQDVWHAVIVRYPENGKVLEHGGGSPIMRAAHASRAWMQAALGRGLEDSPDLHALINSMVLGARGDTPDEIEEQFQQTGTLHLFAVSGLNVAIIATLLWTIAHAARIPRKPAIALIIAALFFYAAITGLNASSIRAALMAAIFLAGFFADRKVLFGNTIAAAAVVVLCVNTNQLFSTGFQLSFAVVIVIILLAERIFRGMVRWSEPDPFLPKSLLSSGQQSWRSAWAFVARGAAVSLAAWLGSLFLILPYFYLITPVSLFANLVVVPLAFFVLAVGLLSLLLTPIAAWLALIFNNANWAVAATILATVELFSRAPAGHFYLERPHWPNAARAEITVLDLGAGGAVHVRSGSEEWLFDTGRERDFKRVVRGYLRSRGINRLNGVVLTHGDAAHIGGAAPVLRAFRPPTVIDSAAPDRSAVHRDLLAQMASLRINLSMRAAPDAWTCGRGVAARILFPPPAHRARAADDQAMVIQFTIDERWRVLLMSDSGEATEKLLLESDADLRSDILIKGQHHSGRSGSPAFIQRVQPKVIVASSPEFPEHEAIRKDWADGVTAGGVKLLRQDETGAVHLRFYRERFEARPYLPGETFRSESR